MDEPQIELWLKKHPQPEWAKKVPEWIKAYEPIPPKEGGYFQQNTLQLLKYSKKSSEVLSYDHLGLCRLLAQHAQSPQQPLPSLNKATKAQITIHQEGNYITPQLDIEGLSEKQENAFLDNPAFFWALIFLTKLCDEIQDHHYRRNKPYYNADNQNISLPPNPLEYVRFRLFELSSQASHKNLSSEQKEIARQAGSTLQTLDQYLTELQLMRSPEQKLDLRFSLNTKEKRARERVNKAMRSKAFRTAIGSYIEQQGGLEQLPEATPTEENSPEKKEVFRHSGHLADNILKKPQPDSENDLFQQLNPLTQNRIKTQYAEGIGTEIAAINRKGEGIKLSKGEYRLLFCLAALLHSQSPNNQNPNTDQFYNGQTPTTQRYRTKEGLIHLTAPSLNFTLYEITKEYNGGLAISGKHVREVASMLYGLAENPEKRVLIRYTRREDLGKGKVREHFIETYNHLINLAEGGYKDLLNGQEIDQKSEVRVFLHPVFRDQLEHKWIAFPTDLTRRMIEANGGQRNISEVTIKLVHYLARAISSQKGAHSQIYKENLLYTVAENYMQPKKRLKKANEMLDKALKTVIDMGMIFGYYEEIGQTGKPKIIFELNREWV